jgi:DNA-binding MarR family transcriptional regulator
VSPCPQQSPDSPPAKDPPSPTTVSKQVPLDRVIAIAEFRAALRRFLRHSERVANARGLTPQQHLLLLMIKGAPDGTEQVTIGEAAERLQLGVSTSTELVDRAQEHGFVRRERSAVDARVVCLRLTAEGERRLAGVLADLEVDRAELQGALQGLATSWRRAMS